jgi:hypothetical protein
VSRGLCLAAGFALLAPVAAFASDQQVLLPGPGPYPTQSPPLTAQGVAQPAVLPFRIHSRSDQKVVAGLDPQGAVVSLRVLQRLVLSGTGDYLIVVGAPVEDVRAASGSESQPGLRTGQILWSGFSPGRKVLAADATLRVAAAKRFLPLRVRAVRRGDRYTVTVTNVTRVEQATYGGDGLARELASLLDQTRRESLARERLTAAYAAIQGLVRLGARPAVVVAPFAVEGELRFTSPPDSVSGGTLRGNTVSFSATLGDERPLSLRVDVHGGGAATRLRLEARPASVVRGLTPPQGSSWAAALRRRPVSAETLLRRLLDTRMQLVRADQYQAFLSNPDRRGRNRTVYVYRSTAAARRASAARDAGSGHADGLVLALAIAGSLLGAGAALVLWAHS